MYNTYKLYIPQSYYIAPSNYNFRNLKKSLMSKRIRYIRKRRGEDRKETKNKTTVFSKLSFLDESIFYVFFIIKYNYSENIKLFFEIVKKYIFFLLKFIFNQSFMIVSL